MQESARLLVALHQNMKGGVSELILATCNSLHHDIQLLMETEDIGTWHVSVAVKMTGT